MFDTQLGHDSKSNANSHVRDLCSSCVKLPDCNYPKAASGVWRCEAYE
jgi:hypothetical protein